MSTTSNSRKAIILAGEQKLGNRRKEAGKKFRLRPDSNPGLPDNSWAPLATERRCHALKFGRRVLFRRFTVSLWVTSQLAYFRSKYKN